MTEVVPSTEPVVEQDAISVRPMRIEHLGEVTDLFRNAGEDALHNRFFTLGDRVVAAHLDDLRAPSHPRCHIAFANGHIVGIVEMADLGKGTEEVAFLVAKGMHHHGIGTTLLSAAIDDARGRGVRTLVADVLATNHLMLEVFRNAGATLSRDVGDVHVALPVNAKGSVHAD